MEFATAKKFLKDTRNDELIKIIANLSSFSKNAEEWLLDYCNQHCRENNSSEFDLVIQKQILHYWHVAEEIIEEANDYGGSLDEEESDAYDALDEIDALAKDHPIPWKTRKEVVDGMMMQFFRQNSGFEDDLIDSCQVLCQSREEKLYLADILTNTKSNYYCGLAANLYLNCGEEESFVKIQSRNLVYGADYIVLADYYMEHQQPDKAIKLVEKALNHADGRLDEVYQWLFDIYKQNNQEEKLEKMYQTALTRKRDIDTITRLMSEYYADNYDRKKEYLLKMPEVCSGGAVYKWFNRCKEELHEDDYRQNERYLYGILKKRDIKNYLQLRIHEGNLQEVFEYLRDAGHSLSDWGIDSGHCFSRQISGTYPKEVCSLYWRECESLCMKSNKQNYRRAVNVLVEIKNISKKNNLSAEWEQMFAAFLEKNRKKRLLIGYINAEKKL